MVDRHDGLASRAGGLGGLSPLVIRRLERQVGKHRDVVGDRKHPLVGGDHRREPWVALPEVSLGRSLGYARRV